MFLGTTDMFDYWSRSEQLILKLNKEFDKVHKAKKDKFYTPEQELRLYTLRKRCVFLTKFRYLLLQKVTT